MSGLADIFAAVVADLAADGVSASVFVGKDYAWREGDPAAGRVVLVTTSWSYGALGAGNGRVGGNPRPIANRAQEIEVHVWAVASPQTDAADQATADFDAVTTLAGRVVLSFYRACRGSLEFGSGQLTADTKSVEYGLEVVFTLTVGVPVVDAAWPYADHGTEIAHSGQMKRPNGAFETLALTLPAPPAEEDP